MKIQTDLKVVAAEGVEKAVASELGSEAPDGDLEQLLAEQEGAKRNEDEDAEDNTESM